MSDKMYPIKVLLVEDDEGDVEITKDALARGKILLDLEVCETADIAYERLQKGELEPDLILLDLNLPGMDGREFLEIIQEDERFTDIPVVVLTTSKRHEDIMRVYNLHAVNYITKPIDPAQFMIVVRSIDTFWFDVVKQPVADKAGV